MKAQRDANFEQSPELKRVLQQVQAMVQAGLPPRREGPYNCGIRGIREEIMWSLWQAQIGELCRHVGSGAGLFYLHKIIIHFLQNSFWNTTEHLITAISVHAARTSYREVDSVRFIS